MNQRFDGSVVVVGLPPSVLGLNQRFKVSVVGSVGSVVGGVVLISKLKGMFFLV